MNRDHGLVTTIPNKTLSFFFKHVFMFCNDHRTILHQSCTVHHAQLLSPKDKT